MKLLNFNIIKLTTCLIIGIIMASYVDLALSSSLLLFSVILGLFTISYLICLKHKFIGFFGIITFLIFVLLGFLRTQLYDETLQDSHYINSNLDIKANNDIAFKITKRLKPNNYNEKYFGEILSINDSKLIGQLLINIQKDAIIRKAVGVGDVLFANTRLKSVSAPKNPFQFNYKKYLKQRNIHHQLYLKQDDFLIIRSTSDSFSAYADDFRNEVNKNLRSSSISEKSVSVINALLLGQRQDIDNETYSNYVNAGVIHILAVSGLHVGIIYLILGFILKPLHYVKHGKFLIKPMIIIVALWLFAFIAGLSPSVTRATTMFSIVAVAGFYKRPTNIYNTLTISAFVLLLYKPIYLFDVGFQLSYLAVFAIVTIQPMLEKLWSAPYYFLKKLWQTFTVTVAAQIGVAPLSMFYFHQFPGLFFLSNLVIIPFLGIILGLGILVIGLAYFDILPPFLATGYDQVIISLNSFIAWVAQFESFLLKDISINILLLFGCYLVLVSFIYLWKKKSGKSIQYLLFSLIFLTGIFIFNKYKNRHSEFVIFNKNRHTLLGSKVNSSLYIGHNLDSSLLSMDKTTQNYRIGNFIKSKKEDSIQSVYKVNNKILLVVDSLSTYEVKSFKPDYILLTNSPKLNLTRLIDSIKPKQIIADASNYKSYIKRWKETCNNKKIPFHSTYEKGAYIIGND